MSSFFNTNQPSQSNHHHTTTTTTNSTSVINFPKVIVQPVHQTNINLPRMNHQTSLKRSYLNSMNSNDMFTSQNTKNLNTQFNELFDFNNNDLSAQTTEQHQPVYLIFEDDQTQSQQPSQLSNNVLMLDDNQPQWLIDNTPTKSNKTNIKPNSLTTNKVSTSSLVVPTITNVDEVFYLLSQKIAKYCQILSDLTNCEVFYKAQLPLHTNNETNRLNKKLKTCTASSKLRQQSLTQHQRSLFWGTHQMLFQFSHDQGIRYDKLAGDSLIKLNQRSISTDVNKLIEEILNAPSSDSKETLSSSSSSSSEQNETINLEKSNESMSSFNLTDELNQIKELNIINKTAKPNEIKFKDCCVYLNKLNDDITNEDYFTKFEIKHNNLETNFMIGHDIVDEVVKETNAYQELNLNELPTDSELYSDGYTLSFNKKEDESDEDDTDEDEDDEKTLIEKNCLNNNSDINENDENYYKCEQCSSSYLYKHLTQLKVHELRKHLNVSLNDSCNKCGLNIFASQEEFYKHAIICYFPNVYQCKTCSQVYDNYPQYLFHIRYIHTQVVYMCSICQRKYKHIKDLIDHDQLIHSKSLNYCELCYESFKTRQLLYDHLKQTHLIVKQIDEVNEKQNEEKLLTSNESTMTKRFVLTNDSDENEIINNDDEEENENEYDEEEQFVVKSIKNILNKPTITATVTSPNTPTTTNTKVQKNELIRGLIDRKHQCKWCSLRFYTKSQLKQHEQVHTNSMLNCPVCDKQFTSKDRLNGHMKCHMEPSLECKVCGKKFKRLCNLYNHELVHGLTEHAFMLCQFCGRGFRSRRDYQNHVIANHRDHLMKVDSDGKVIDDSNESFSTKTNRRQRKQQTKKIEQTSNIHSANNTDSADETYFTRTGVHFAQDDLDDFQMDDEENEEDDEERFNENKRLKKNLKDKNTIKRFKLNNRVEVEEDGSLSQDYSSIRNTTPSNGLNDKNQTHTSNTTPRSGILTHLFEENFT